MNRQLHTRDEAELDIIDAVAWYEEQRAGLGGEFVIELDAVMQRMAQTSSQPLISVNCASLPRDLQCR